MVLPRAYQQHQGEYKVMRKGVCPSSKLVSVTFFISALTLLLFTNLARSAQTPPETLSLAGLIEPVEILKHPIGLSEFRPAR